MPPIDPYEDVIVESYIPDRKGGQHGLVHIRPVPGGKYPTTLNVECAKSLSRDYPVGTRFKLRAKLVEKDTGGDFLYSYFGWKAEVLK